MEEKWSAVLQGLLHGVVCIGIQLYVSVYSCMFRYTAVCICIQRYVSVYSCMHLYTAVCIGIQLYAYEYSGMHRYASVYSGMHRCTVAVFDLQEKLRSQMYD